MTRKSVVIVGGGTAGLVIANRLQEQFDVTVVEKSPYANTPLFYRIPLMIGLLFRAKVLKYMSKRELTLSNGRIIPFFESKVLGGASVINGCVHMVGSRRLWDGILSRFNSSYDDLMAGYDGLYSNRRCEPHKITLRQAPLNDVDRAFLSSVNLPAGDMVFSDSPNCGPVNDTIRHFFRTSVMSLLAKKNFRILLGQEVHRLLIENGQISGVETDQGMLNADHVILCGGMIGSNRLMLRTDLPELAIGQEIRDHTNLRVNVLTNRPIGSLNEVYRSFRQQWEIVIKHVLGISTLMVGTGATSGVHLDLDGDGVVDTRIHVVQFSETGRHCSDGKYFMNRPGFSLSITPIRPTSKGQITKAGDDVSIDPGYLSAPQDVQLLKTALAYCIQLLRTEPLAGFVEEIIDLDQIEGDPETYIADNIFSGHHLIGGLQNAVDADFAVKGVAGLSVCDASVFEDYAASNIHSSVVLLADLFARRFLEKSR